MPISSKQDHITVFLPKANGARPDQDAEWCEVAIGDEPVRRLRFHDYADIYNVPGLYERIFQQELRCTSPKTVCGMLDEVLARAGRDPADLRVLDLGAGNGMVGEELRDLGVSHLVGVDIIEEACRAAERDRPGLYDSYLVADMTDLAPEDESDLREAELNCLTSVAALGFGDIPPLAFATAFNVLTEGALVVFTIRDRFLDNQTDASGYRKLIDRMLEESVLEPVARRRYRHRMSMRGEPLYYYAVVAEKRDDVPADWT